MLPQRSFAFRERFPSPTYRIKDTAGRMKHRVYCVFPRGFKSILLEETGRWRPRSPLGFSSRGKGSARDRFQGRDTARHTAQLSPVVRNWTSANPSFIILFEKVGESSGTRSARCFARVTRYSTLLEFDFRSPLLRESDVHFRALVRKVSWCIAFRRRAFNRDSDEVEERPGWVGEEAESEINRPVYPFYCGRPTRSKFLRW